MMPQVLNDVTVVVRECGERTAEHCASLLRELLGVPVQRVSAPEFTVVLRRSLEAGLASRRTWLLCVDADVLPLSDLIAFLDEASALHQDVFAAQALVRDKLMFCQRPAGNHLYRTELIPEALALIPIYSTRPETSMLQAMGAKGFPLHQSRRVVGLHDYEQHWADLYAKAYLHARKHAEFRYLFEPYWQELATTDADYRVALKALQDAENAGPVPNLARSQTARQAQTAQCALRLADKPPLEYASPAARHQALRQLANTQLGPLADRLQHVFDAAVFPPPIRRRWPSPRTRALVADTARWARLLLPVLR